MFTFTLVQVMNNNLVTHLFERRKESYRLFIYLFQRNSKDKMVLSRLRWFSEPHCSFTYARLSGGFPSY